jgi:5-dehydro-2-deoxygluconokinase
VPDLELLTVGRVNLDLYSQQTGVAFAEARGWDAMVGGSPANVALAAARLDLRAGLLSAVGEDPVGDWVLRGLERGGVDTSAVARKRGPHTSLALRAQLPPEHPLAFYRHDPADVHLSEEDVARAPIERTRALLLSADALARGTTAELCPPILRRASAAGSAVFLDLDLRHVNWPDLDAYAAKVGAAVEHADVVVGTEEEFTALLGLRATTDVAAVAAAVEARVSRASGRVVVLKRGGHGATVFDGPDAIDVPAYPVTEASTVGAGDTFAAGLISARLAGRDWAAAGAFAGAAAAITVSRWGCSDGFPRLVEVAELMDGHAVAAGERS